MVSSDGLSGVTITSKTNPLVKDLAGLRRSAGRRRHEGVTLVEGFKILELALDAGNRPIAVLHDDSSTVADDRRVLDRARQMGATIRPVTTDVLAKVSAREGPMGCVASVHLAEWPLSRIELGSPPLLLVVEGLEKPGNLGALARTASAAGADALVAADSQTDIFSPATVHASLGSVFQLPVVRCTSAEALDYLEAKGIEVVATSPDADKAYFELDLARPVAIAVGNEHRGLSESWLGAGQRALIPMSGPMNSLNATTAGGIVLFEAVRQRHSARA
ncbi:MAG TPA: RNA methyltransferase [Acidimicrobiales bacterium]|nr:RNA methyltransferase [Acidimicrobiales bacterium]